MQRYINKSSLLLNDKQKMKAIFFIPPKPPFYFSPK